MQNCMVSCKTEKVSCLSAQKRWCFLTAIDYTFLSFVIKMDDAFILKIIQHTQETGLLIFYST